MRAAGLEGREPKRFNRTTIPDPDVDGRPDLIRRAFTPDPTVINTRWCGDITYIRTWEGWLYLATVIDLDSRKVVGWATADHMRTDLIAEALTNAVATHRLAPGLIFHSDRGSQGTPQPSSRLSQPISGSLSRSGGPGRAGTTPSRSRSSRPSGPNYCTATPGPPGPEHARRSSNGSRAGTTCADATPRSATSALRPGNTEPDQQSPSKYPERTTTTVSVELAQRHSQTEAPPAMDYRWRWTSSAQELRCSGAQVLRRSGAREPSAHR